MNEIVIVQASAHVVFEIVIVQASARMVFEIVIVQASAHVVFEIVIVQASMNRKINMGKIWSMRLAINISKMRSITSVCSVFCQ